MSGVYDPALAEASVQRLAAVTDAELATDIRSAYADLINLAEQRRKADGWPAEHWERVAYMVLVDGRDALAGLPDEVQLIDLIAAASPMLGQWWPDRPASAQPMAAAVERLRAAAKIRPILVADCRRLAAQD